MPVSKLLLILVAAFAIVGFVTIVFSIVLSSVLSGGKREPEPAPTRVEWRYETKPAPFPYDRDQWHNRR